MDYSFQPFLDAVGTNWYDDDDVLHELLTHHSAPDAYDTTALSSWGGEVAGPLRRLAEESARVENRPRLERYDAYRRRVDRIVLPASTLSALAEVEGRQRLGAAHGDPFAFYSRGYLYAQNGEAGVMCSVACTDGMVRVLEARGDRPEHREAVERIRGSTVERVWHGAQFVTEIQGGSDVPANDAEATPDGDAWRIRGRKWFCSNVNADYFLVTCRPAGAPKGAEGVSLFLVPAYLEPGDWRRNGYTIDRLKDKLGTRELATAEVSFDDALGWPVGPLEGGLSRLLRYVLVTSRFYCVLYAASTLRQAERIASAFAHFRTAFGRILVDFPLVQDRLREIGRARRRALACCFELLRLWERGGQRGDEAEAPKGEAALDFRILLSLCKPVLTMAATRLTHDAMMLLGGNGIEERFSSLPRLYRDSVIMETWEGPHDVLFTQALRDLRRYGVDAAGFVERVAGPGSSELAGELAGLVREAGDRDATVPLRRLAPRIVAAFGDRALEEAGCETHSEVP